MSGPFLVFRSIYPGVMGNNDQLPCPCLTYLF